MDEYDADDDGGGNDEDNDVDDGMNTSIKIGVVVQLEPRQQDQQTAVGMISG